MAYWSATLAFKVLAVRLRCVSVCSLLVGHRSVADLQVSVALHLYCAFAQCRHPWPGFSARGTIKWIWAKTVFGRWYPEMMYANHLYLYELNVKEKHLESNAFNECERIRKYGTFLPADKTLNTFWCDLEPGHWEEGRAWAFCFAPSRRDNVYRTH